MKAVTGSVARAKRIKLSKAAAIISRFAASGGGENPEVAAYLGRAATAFEELARFHRGGVAGGERIQKKEKEAEAEDGGDGNLTDVGEDTRKKKRKRRQVGMED